MDFNGIRQAYRTRRRRVRLQPDGHRRDRLSPDLALHLRSQPMNGASDCHPRRRLRAHAKTRGDVRVRQPLFHAQDDQAAVAHAQRRELVPVAPHTGFRDEPFERRHTPIERLTRAQCYERGPPVRSPDLIDDAVAYRFAEIGQEGLIVPELEAMELAKASHHGLLHDIVCANGSAASRGQVTLRELPQTRQV
jgi:hypothetical protein